MESFYGGKQGASFVIKQKFSSIDEMVEQFSKGSSYRDVWYGEFCIIDTVNKNEEDNGKIFRRGLNYSGELGGAEYVGQIVGPSSGTPYFQMDTIENVKDISTSPLEEYEYRNYPVGRDENGDFILSRSEEGHDQEIGIFDFSNAEKMGLVPGKYINEEGQEQFNDEIKWTWCNIRKANTTNDSWFYVGFEIPYLVVEYSSILTSPYDENGEISSNPTFVEDITPDKDEHPFYNKLQFKIPHGVKGQSIGNLKVLTPVTAEDVVYDLSSVQFIDGIFDIENAKIYEGFEEDVEQESQILVYELYNYDHYENPEPIMIYLGDFKIITRINLAEDGTLSIEYTHGEEQFLEEKIKWVETVTIDTDGNFVLTFNDGSSIEQKIRIIQRVSFVDNENYTDENGKIYFTTNMTTEEGQPEKLYLKANDSNEDYRMKVIERLSVSKNITDDSDLKAEYNTEPNAISISDNINYVVDMVVRKNDKHLLALFRDPKYRQTGEGWVTDVVESEDYRDLYWKDFGTIQDRSGLLVGTNVEPQTIKDYLKLEYETPTIEDILTYLDAVYENGLGTTIGDETYQKIVTVGVRTDTENSKLFFAFDYNKPADFEDAEHNWYLLGSLEISPDIDIMVLPQGYDKSEEENLALQGIILLADKSAPVKTIDSYWNPRRQGTWE